jgi:hypothetical protein
MIQLAVDCLKFGSLAVRRAQPEVEHHYCVPAPAFEIIQLLDEGRGVAIARVEVERCDVPALKVHRLARQERCLDAGASAAVTGPVVLAHWRDELPTHFKLSAFGTEDYIEILLSGDCRRRLFWWRAEFRLVDDQVTVHGPFLSVDHD